MKILTSIFISILLIFSSNSVKSADDFIEGDPSILNGVWTIQTSSSELHIECDGSVFTEISLIDTSDKKHIVDVSDVEWDGKFLTFTAICRTNNKWKTYHKIYPKSPCSITDEITGDIEIKEVWRKKSCQLQNGI